MGNPVRQKILTTAASLLELQGYHGTGMNQIVEESDTPRGSLYYYFPDGKEELASEAVALRMEAMAEYTRQSLDQFDDPIEAVYALIVEISANMAKPNCDTGAPIAAVALEASTSSERLREACADGYLRLEEAIAAKLASGEFSTEEAASLATTIQSGIEGAMIVSRVTRDPEVLVKLANHTKLLLQGTLRA
ncbi:MAG: TetR/AcrR family transcriptional regulator [Actinomycetota bacterium]|nr:TetR/AcrR family transcriptional regulator [Actinomycetota bacterium]